MMIVTELNGFAGMRVSLREMKREKYGKVPLVGSVKWMGTLDRRQSHHRLYLGLKLDSRCGNTDGIVYGKRLFKCMSGWSISSLGKKTYLQNLFKTFKTVFFKKFEFHLVGKN